MASTCTPGLPGSPARPDMSVANFRRYGATWPWALRVVLMFATLAAMVSMRTRCASSPLAPVSSTSNIDHLSVVRCQWSVVVVELRTTDNGPLTSSHPFLQRHVQGRELLAEQLDDHVVHHRVLRLVGHELLGGPVGAVVEQHVTVRLLHLLLRRDAVERHGPRRCLPPLVGPAAERLLEALQREVLLPVVGRAE